MQGLTGGIPAVYKPISELPKYPHSIALSYGDRQLSYAELDRRADRFAGYLMQLGIVPGDTVAICMERSFDWIVAALGIMRVGAAYVPLDAAWPDSRLRFAVEDSGATGLVARTALLNCLPVKARGVDPCRDAAAIASAPRGVRASIKPDSLAYLIYTSGSSGNPRGVEITHANLSHLIRWHRNAFNVTRKDRVSHLAGLGFDAAVWEIWPNLAAGATLCLADDALRSSPELMQQWMIGKRVTIAFVPTVHAAPMMAMEWPRTTALRLLLTGGDVLHHAPAVPLPFDVVNNYGPTECTVVATSSIVKPGSQGAPPIGRPIAGAKVYLLNEQGEPVPNGGIGEIYISGSGVARGYRNLPDATERSFLPDPFAGVPDARMYRTGDLGIRRPDGEIVFRGRLDRQTKIRGQRVELDEIASILSRHPSIAFATAITDISEQGENQLVAYVLLKENVCVPTTRQLQEHLLRSLPDYMIPPLFVRVDALPLSPNGKLDSKRLPAPTLVNLLKGEAAKKPSTPIEEKLLTIMRELLKNDAVRIEDNFFLAGGHSLLGMQLVMHVRNAFGVDLTMRQLLEAPSIERLALVIENTLKEMRLAAIWTDLLGCEHVEPDDNFFELGGRPDLVKALEERIAIEFGRRIPIEKLIQSPTLRQQVRLLQVQLTDDRVLSPGVMALQPHGTGNRIFWVHYLNGNLPAALGDDHSFVSVTITADDVVSLGEAPTLQSIAGCVVRKILATQSEGPYTIGGYSIGGVLAFEVASQLQAAAGHEISLLVLLDPPYPSCLGPQNPLSPKLTQLGYILKRSAHLGLRKSFVKLRDRLLKVQRTEMAMIHRMVERAAAAYQPQEYAGEGKVLLLLASQRPPDVNFLPGWQAVVPRNLDIQYVNVHHEDLINNKNMRIVAAAIVSHLQSSTDRQSVLRPANQRTGSLSEQEPTRWIA